MHKTLSILLLLLTGTAYAQNGSVLWPERLRTACATRLTSGPYKSYNDTRNAAGALFNSPGDGDRIMAAAKAFVIRSRTNKLNITNAQLETSDIWLGALPGVSIPNWHGYQMQCAAFVGWALSDTGYAKPAARALDIQCALGGLTNPSNWLPLPNRESHTQESIFATRTAYTADWVKWVQTGGQTTRSNAYLDSWATYNLLRFNQSSIKQAYPSWPSLTPRSACAMRNNVNCKDPYNRPAGAKFSINGDDVQYTHRNADGSMGNILFDVHGYANNREADRQMAIGIIGQIRGNATWITQSKNYDRFDLQTGTFKDGTTSEYERNGETYGGFSQGAMNYNAKRLQKLYLTAFHRAVAGDFTQFDYATAVSDSIFGTGAVKTMLTPTRRYMWNHTRLRPLYFGPTATETYRIQHIGSDGQDNQWRSLASIPNTYYRLDSLKRFYECRLTNIAPYGSKKASANIGVYVGDGGTGLELPGIMILFAGHENSDLFNQYPTKTLSVAFVDSSGSVAATGKSYVLKATVTNGTVSTWKWERVAGSTAVALSGTNTDRLQINGLKGQAPPAGTHTYKVTAILSDGSVMSATSGFTRM